MQRFYIDVLHTHKAGNFASEYEDAFWPPQPCRKPADEPLRVAVADGATDAMYSGVWARLLVRAYANRGMTGETADAELGKAGRIWTRVVGSKSVPWYAEEKASKGAYAALVGVELTRKGGTDGGDWTAFACGDCCCFQLRSDAVIHSFPISRSEEFGNTPLLLGSHPGSRGLEGMRAASGTWKEGDCFYLMSDALAAWFLAQCEAGIVPWQCLRDVTLAQKPAFDEWISDMRRRQAIKNDDCTLVAISFEHSADAR